MPWPMWRDLTGDGVSDGGGGWSVRSPKAARVSMHNCSGSSAVLGKLYNFFDDDSRGPRAPFSRWQATLSRRGFFIAPDRMHGEGPDPGDVWGREPTPRQAAGPAAPDYPAVSRGTILNL
jgi:hypothetical protein